MFAANAEAPNGVVVASGFLDLPISRYKAAVEAVVIFISAETSVLVATTSNEQSVVEPVLNGLLNGTILAPFTITLSALISFPGIAPNVGELATSLMTSRTISLVIGRK